VDLTRVLAQLRMELENIDMAIASLERLATQKQRSLAQGPGEVRRRGRPPKLASSVSEDRMSLQKRSDSK
jgi:hypothetical protein